MYEELKKLAKAATRGPWVHSGNWVSTVRGNSVADCPRGDEEFIAAANPSAVLALIKDLESHKRMLLAAAVDIGSIGEALGAEMDDDASELAGIATDLRQDARRLNWLDARMSPVIENQSYAQPEGELAGYDWGVFGQCGSVREAIDDAMSRDVDQ